MSEQKHIILVDDESLIHISLEMILHGSKYRMTSILDPEEAIRYVKSKDKYDKPDLLIIDFMMGKISGIDVISALRADAYFDNIPIILYTGFHEVIINQREMLEELKIACVLPKMLYKEELLPIIDSLTNSSS